MLISINTHCTPTVERHAKYVKKLYHNVVSGNETGVDDHANVAESEATTTRDHAGSQVGKHDLYFIVYAAKFSSKFYADIKRQFMSTSFYRPWPQTFLMK